MPRISDLFIDVAVYIYPDLDAAKLGVSQGGSGFVVEVPLEQNPDWTQMYVVTNSHVVERAKTPVIRLNRTDGTTECIPTTAGDWTPHKDGDDVAVLPFDVEQAAFLKFCTLRLKDFVTPELVYAEDIGIGDDTVMVGRFINHEGTQQNSPAVRFGNIAMMPKEKIISETGFPQESFLVEVKSLPGYSGSAILLYSPCATNDMSQRRFGKPNSSPPIGKGLWQEDSYLWMKPKGPYLLGIDWCHISRRAKILNRDRKPIDEGWYVEENTGMAGVVPAWKIAEILNSEEFKMQRQKEDQEITRKKTTSAVSLDYGGELQATQITPKGAEIPIPTQEQFLGDLTKASRRVKLD